MWVQYLGWEDLLEEGMGTHSNILACRIPWAIVTNLLSVNQQSNQQVVY